MTLVRLGYAAMSMNLQNASPSQTMTYKQFSAIKDREAAIAKLERIARSNLENCLRLLKHNVHHEIHFFRFSSKLIPLANHPELKGWDFISPLKGELHNIKGYLNVQPMRVGFHPDHFVLLNTSDVDVLKNTFNTLKMHRDLLKGMGIDPTHRCVLHVGGAYDDKEKALEQFIHNWGLTPAPLQGMIILENDDTVFSASDALYLCEKLGIPQVFDYHHHLAYHERDWQEDWERIVSTWSQSPLPVKMHISSPRSDRDYKAHADYIDPAMFMDFLQGIKGSIDQVDCMIEAKKKDDALFRLVEDLKTVKEIEWVDQSSFIIH
ncbi:UV DNA damage repair endonuclease UvsE [Bacillus haikouensis]|uniref:UV DNA damage repair endonuclease UvsE n=1 Tax=Bacillus haikouensis TaxID=1510468 RepID=UPI0015522339|nr:UV DNA damage repair endonuclease UvsE [Bacillus haikouensis]NQD66469.1 UV DNA damage repair endonuclease UvsE [Bacillus haikouensis]